MRVNQHYLIAQRNLIVEGAHDYWIITELANLFDRSHEDSLSDDIVITAAGSASAVVHLATFMIGQGLQVVSLFDSDHEGREHEKRLRTKWLAKYKSDTSTTLLLGSAVGS